MKRAIALLGAAIAAGVVLAGVTIKPEPPSYELHSLPDNKLVPGPWPTSATTCRTMGENLVKAGTLQDFACVTREKYTVAKTCTDERAPHIPLTRNAEDPKLWDEPEARAIQPDATDDTRWDTVQWLYVRNPKGDAAYPNCWIRGDADPMEWCVNGVNPAAPFMQRTDEPGACPELPNSVEAMPTPPGFQEEWRSKEACEQRHESCLVYPKGSDGESCGPPPPKCVLAENFYK